MPIEIQYTDDNIGIIFSAVGKVTGKEIIESQSDIYQSKGFVNLRYWIVDRSRCTEYEVSSDEVSRIAALDNETAKINPNLIMALISESDLQFGVSRMYEAQISEDGFKTMVFRDRSTADKWIQSELNKT
jgi:hypothetical protein